MEFDWNLGENISGVKFYPLAYSSVDAGMMVDSAKQIAVMAMFAGTAKEEKGKGKDLTLTTTNVNVVGSGSNVNNAVVMMDSSDDTAAAGDDVEDWKPEDLLAFAAENSLTVVHVNFDNNQDSSKQRIQQFVKFQFENPVRAFAWGHANPSKNPNLAHARLIAALSDFKIYEAEYKNEKAQTKALYQHTDFVNDCAVNLTSFDKFLASVSDDQTCIIWKQGNENQPKERSYYWKIELTSPGIAVQWHVRDQSHLMIAERLGLIRIVDWVNKTPYLNLYSENPLISIDWSYFDYARFGALTEKEYLIWNLWDGGVQICLPDRHYEVRGKSPRLFRWSKTRSDQFATIEKNYTVRVKNLNHASSDKAFAMSHQCFLTTDISWHIAKDWLVSSANRTLKFFFVKDDWPGMN